MKVAIEKARTLIEALPYIKRFHQTIFVIKYGGSILQDNAVRESVLEDKSFKDSLLSVYKGEFKDLEEFNIKLVEYIVK